MPWTKMKTVIVVGIGVLLAVGIATVTVKKFREHQNEVWQLGNMDTKLLLNLSHRTVIVPTKSAERSRQNGSGGMTWMADGRIYGINASIADMLRVACVDNGSVSQNRIVFNVEIPTNKYDFFSNLPIGSKAALQREIQRKFGVIAKRETRETGVLLLKINRSGASGLKSGTAKRVSVDEDKGRLSCVGYTLDSLAANLEQILNVLVLNQTGLVGNFDINLKWDATDWQHRNPDALKQSLIDQLGLELVLTNMPVEMLVIEKAQN